MTSKTLYELALPLSLALLSALPAAHWCPAPAPVAFLCSLTNMALSYHSVLVYATNMGSSFLVSSLGFLLLFMHQTSGYFIYQVLWFCALLHPTHYFHNPYPNFDYFCSGSDTPSRVKRAGVIPVLFTVLFPSSNTTHSQKGSSLCTWRPHEVFKLFTTNSFL